MSLKFPVIRPGEGEIVEPDDLNQNIKQFTDEINGNLTHDNLSSFDLTQEQFKDETFSKVFQSSFESSGGWDTEASGFKVSKQHSGYVAIDERDKKMPLVNFMAERDGYIIVDFFVSFIWKGTGILNEEELERFHLIEDHYPVDHDPIIWGHKSELPAGGWIGAVGQGESSGSSGSATGRGYHPDNMLNAFNFDGAVVSTGLKATDFPQGRWCVDGMDRFAVKFRVLSNGNEICESGWVYNGVDRNSIYLTGVIPVRAGRNEVRTEVAAAMLQSMYGVNQGVRAKTQGGLKGQFFPKSFYSSRDVAMPLPKSVRKTLTRLDLQQLTGTTVQIDFGINCTVQASNLVVQYRKA